MKNAVRGLDRAREERKEQILDGHYLDTEAV
jgi:hypothetical protein